MELNSLLILLEAAEYLERRDREAEHGYASVLPHSPEYSRKKSKTTQISRKAPILNSPNFNQFKQLYLSFALFSPVLPLWVWIGSDSAWSGFRCVWPCFSPGCSFLFILILFILV
uniref:BHLH domain-containing protein n=1 Tax=Astyanax mexicanus TaxID=7994 RepID=A0A8B9H298_ASTMX